MSGDVQPRKRKDKKRKKEDLGVEEPRGTAAVFGEGDVFMHSQHEHGTGGHWCAKVIFFSLLAVLVTLIGLIILENRGLTDLEASSVESRYAGVLEGWLEDAPDDGHHDEHTLELKHHADVGGHDNDDEHSQEIDQTDEENHDDEHEDADEHDDEVDQDEDQSDEDDEDNEEDNDGNDEDDEISEEQDIKEADEDDGEEPAYRRYVRSAEYQRGDDDDDDEDEDNDDDLQKVDENDSMEDNDENDESPEQDDVDDQSVEENDDDNDQSLEDGDDDKDQTIDGDDDNNDEDDNADEDNSDEDADNSNEDENDTREDEDEEEHDDKDVDSGVEVEKLEKEISDEDALSTEEPEPESKEDINSQEDSNEDAPEEDVDDEEEYVELDDIDEPLPIVEHIKVPAGKPLAEVEEDTTSEKPQDTLAEEEEYEKQQEELRREEAEASHIWLKLVVGGALLAATHAVLRRATATRDVPDDHASREETPAIDRRMTLIPEEAAAPATPSAVVEEPVIEEEILEMVSSAIHSTAPVQHESEEEDDDVEEIEFQTKEVTTEPVKDTVDKELYSDEDEEDDEDEEEEIIVLKKETPTQSAPVTQKSVPPEPQPEPEEEVPDDVEIIDDEQLDEELEEEEEEDDISDVDDAELLSRLEAKYGRLPEPERPGQKHKDGGNSIEDEWPGEPSDVYWRQQLDQAEQELRQGDWSAASRLASAAELSGSARGKWLVARALDASAESRRDNALLSHAIAAYLDLLKMNERFSDNILLQITNRTLDRIRFRGSYLSAEPVYRLLIRRFPDVPDYRNNLTVTFLMANRADLAEEAIKETLKRWPYDRVALAHYGFVLKTQHNRLEEAVDAFRKALKDDVGPATEPRFYYHLGDSLLLLGRYSEAHEVHKRGAALGHFLSPAQRSLYNVERLKSQPWWTIEQTPYLKLARALEKSWKEILKEGEAARALYEKEKEGLKERGEWSQLDLFVRGQEVPDRCKRAPVTCSIVRSEPAAIGCRRGQVKFSLMEAGTHVRPHVGPTNCRLRMHLGLSNTKDTYIRVDQEIRGWRAGKVFMFDDSFEHEVWHNGTGSRLVLIVDVWHPDLAPAERRSLPPI